MLDGIGLVLFPASAYLLGSIPFAFVVGRLGGVDLRRAGTMNVGAGNVRRLVGLPAAILAAVLDGLKGLVPVAVSRQAGLPEAAVIVTGLAAVAGHNWPLFLNFRGGRGLATSVGVVLGVNPWLLVWPTLWAIAGWWIGGGIAGFVGWGLLPVVAVVAALPAITIPLAFGLSALFLLRRMQGNTAALPGFQAALHRALFDRDPSSAEAVES